MSVNSIELCDNPAIAGRAERYMTVRVDTARILQSWRESLMAHEWLTPEGTVREPDGMNMLDRDKILKVRKALQSGSSLPRPVLGIGILDNVEIGAGRDVFCVLAAMGASVIDVHIPRSNEAEFVPYLA